MQCLPVGPEPESLIFHLVFHLISLPPLDFGDNAQALAPELQNKTNFDYRRYQRLCMSQAAVVVTLQLRDGLPISPGMAWLYEILLNYVTMR